MKQNRYFRLSFSIPLFPCKKHRQAGNYRHADQYHLNLAACFRLATVKEPQRAVELPMTRPFPTEQQSCKPKDKQCGCKQQSVFRMSLRHSKKDSALPFIASYISVIVILIIKRIPNTKIMFSAHLIITLCQKTMCRMLFICCKNSIFAKMKSRDGFQTEI